MHSVYLTIKTNIHSHSQRRMINYFSLLLLFYQKIISVWFMCKTLKINAIYELENVLCLSERSYDQAECMFNATIILL